MRKQLLHIKHTLLSITVPLTVNAGASMWDRVSHLVNVCACVCLCVCVRACVRAYVCVSVLYLRAIYLYNKQMHISKLF